MTTIGAQNVEMLTIIWKGIKNQFYGNNSELYSLYSQNIYPLHEYTSKKC